MEAATIRAEVRAVMEKEFAEGHVAQRTNLGLPEEKSVKSGTALQSESVIDLATVSQSENRATLGSPISVVSIRSHSGNGTRASRFT